MPPSLQHTRRIARALALLSVCACVVGCVHPGNYQQAWMQTQAIENSYANGYATIGFSPSIFTIPNRAFTALRTCTVNGRSGEVTVHIARDRRGRVHYESCRSANEISVIVSDPVEHAQLRYVEYAHPSPRHSLVVKQCSQPLMRDISHPNFSLNASPQIGSYRLASFQQPSPQPPAPYPDGRFDLGVQNFEGFRSYGERDTHTINASFGVRTISIERWFSPDLGLSMLETDESSGEPARSVTTHGIQLVDPDPAFFLPPAGYTLDPDLPSCVPH